MKILFDECLSPKLVEYFRTIITCAHVHDVGLGGSSDQKICRWARKNNHVIASKNGRDFVELMPNGHPGLIWLVDGHLTLKQQRKAIFAAIEYCKGRRAFIRVELMSDGRYECSPIG